MYRMDMPTQVNTVEARSFNDRRAEDLVRIGAIGMRESLARSPN